MSTIFHIMKSKDSTLLLKYLTENEHNDLNSFFYDACLCAQFNFTEGLHLLIRMKCDVNICTKNDGKNMSPLFVAVTKNSVDCVDLLLQNGATVNSKTVDTNSTPLIQACENENKAIVVLLLKRDPDLSIQRADNQKDVFDVLRENRNDELLNIITNYKNENQLKTSNSKGEREEKEEKEGKEERKEEGGNEEELIHTKAKLELRQNLETESKMSQREGSELMPLIKIESNNREFLQRFEKAKDCVAKICMQTSIDLNQKLKYVEKVQKDKGFIEHTSELREQLFLSLEKENQQIMNELKTLKSDLHILKEETNPIINQSNERQRVLLEQQAILKNNNLNTFYRLILGKLSAKFISAILLLEGMLQRTSSGSGEEGGKLFFSLLGGVAEATPFIGGVLGAFIDFTGTSAVEGLAQMNETKKYERVQNGVVNVEDANKFCEIIARKVTLSYQFYIEKQNSLDSIKSAGKKIAEFIYDYLSKGKLKCLPNETIETKADEIVRIVQREAAKVKKHFFNFFEQGYFFNEPLSPAYIYFIRDDHREKANLNELE